jgi:hypothetical protein
LAINRPWGGFDVALRWRWAASPGHSAFFILPSAFTGWSGGGVVLVWGRSDVYCTNLCYCNTYEISKVALAAPMCRMHRRRSPDAGPARLPCSALKLLRLSHLWCKCCFVAVLGGMKARKSSFRSAMFIEDKPWNIRQAPSGAACLWFKAWPRRGAQR